MDNRNIPMFDAGHGGMIGGVYQTSGKRSFDWELGVLYEGMFNRWITNLVIRELDYMKIPYFHISPEFEDIGLTVRSNRANRIQKKYNNAYLFSIHANAGGGTGIEGFTSIGDTPSDPLAETFLSNLQGEFEFKDWKFRFDQSDGDRDKEAGYQVLRKTKGRAFLLECGFMDHKRDYKLLWDRDYQQDLACNIAHTMRDLYESQ